MIDFGPLTALVGALDKVVGWFKGRPSKDKGEFAIPRKSLILVDSPYDSGLMWSMGRIGEKPAMQVFGRIRATNIAKRSIHPTVKWKSPVQYADVSVEGLNLERLAGSIPPGWTVELIFHFSVQPPIKKVGETFKTRVGIEDQFGKRFWTRTMKFPYRGPM